MRKMSHLKLFRSSLPRRLLCNLSPCVKRSKRQISDVGRGLATQTATVADCKFLTSPWGEIEVGNETLTEHVFKDFELWPDQPSVVSFI